MFEYSYGHVISDEACLECNLCWWVYTPELGDVIGQIPAGIPFSSLPDQWRCPQCDADKQHFLLME